MTDDYLESLMLKSIEKSFSIEIDNDIIIINELECTY